MLWIDATDAEILQEARRIARHMGCERGRVPFQITLAFKVPLRMDSARDDARMQEISQAIVEIGAKPEADRVLRRIGA